MRDAHSQRAGRSADAVTGRAGDAAQMQAAVPLEAKERRPEQARGSANGLGPDSMRPRDVRVRAPADRVVCCAASSTSEASCSPSCPLRSLLSSPTRPTASAATPLSAGPRSTPTATRATSTARTRPPPLATLVVPPIPTACIPAPATAASWPSCKVRMPSVGGGRGTFTCSAPRILYEQAVSFTDARLSARSWHRCLDGLMGVCACSSCSPICDCSCFAPKEDAGQRELRQRFPRTFDRRIDKREETVRR